MTEPLTARVFVRAGVRYLRLDGSHDALEAWVPMGSGEPLQFGNLVKYLRADGAQIEVHTFPGHHLDPIIEFFSPQIRRIDIGDQTGYVFGGEQGDDGATLATAGPSGDLVIVSATQAGIDIEQLIDMTQNLVER